MDKLIFYMGYPFVRNAMVVAVMVALSSSLLGVPLVLKRFSFIGDGLSHIAFGALIIAGIFNLSNEMPLVLAVTVACAVLILKTGQNANIRGDAVIAMISVSSLAVGYLLVNRFSTSANISGDVCTTLFGSTSILTLSRTDVLMCCILSAVVVIAFVTLYNRIFSVTFDENFASATGTNADLYNLLIAVITAVIIVIAMKLVGSLLISALVVFPALSAMRVFSSFKAVTVCAAVLSVLCAFLGLSLSIVYGTPVGSTIVVADMAAFAIFAIIGRLKRRI